MAEDCAKYSRVVHFACTNEALLRAKVQKARKPQRNGFYSPFAAVRRFEETLDRGITEREKRPHRKKPVSVRELKYCD